MTYDYGEDDAGAGFEPPRPFTKDEGTRALLLAHMLWRERQRLVKMPDGSEKNRLRKWTHEAEQELVAVFQRHDLFDHTWTHADVSAAGLDKHGLPVSGLTVHLDVMELRGGG